MPLNLCAAFLIWRSLATAPKSDQKEYLRQAQGWLRKVGEFPDAKGKQRYQLHLIRLLIVKGDTEKAEAELGELRKIVPKSLSRQRSFFIIEAVLYAAQKDFDNARDAVMKALAEILPLAEREAVREYRLSDPVLEAECYVLLAQIYAAKKDYPAARHYLDRWRLLSQFVENHYLHRLAERIVTTGIPFQLECEYPIYDEGTGEVIKTIVQRTKEFELWLLDNARARHPKFLDEELSRIWGKDRSTFSRHFGGLSQEKIRAESGVRSSSLFLDISVWSTATPVRSLSIPVMERIKGFFKILLRMIYAHAEIFFAALFPVFVWHAHFFKYLVQLTSAAVAVNSDCITRRLVRSTSIQVSSCSRSFMMHFSANALVEFVKRRLKPFFLASRRKNISCTSTSFFG